jgi:hypothetical protein
MNKEEHNRKNRRWASSNRKKSRECTRKWANKNYHKILWHSSKSTAKRRELEHTVSKEEFFDLYATTSICKYLGVELLKDLDVIYAGHEPFRIPIDRIDNAKGYISGNIQFISKMANTMKSSASLIQLRTFARNVLEHHSE